ncbi:ABC transporter permease [Mesomycoplasma hyorhinis]|nr:ABC transporter permease [Mesomycoplasma hyorhinis]
MNKTISSSPFKNNNYFKFLFKIIFKKYSTFALPIVSSFLTLILALVAFFTSTSSKTFLIFTYITLFINLLFTVVYSSYKFLNIFKDLNNQGIDLITFTKPYTRKYIIVTKILFLIFLASIWSLLFYINFTIFFLINIKYIDQVNMFYIWAFFSPLFTFLIFGSLSGLLVLKFSSKVSLSLPILVFTPLLFLGSVPAFYSTPTNEKLAQYFNLKYPNTDSNTILRTEKFYLNNNKDNYYLIPKQVDNLFLDQQQINFLNEAKNKSQNSATLWQAFSYILVPYQFINIFNIKDEDAIKSLGQTNENALSNYIYYSNLQTAENNYSIQNSTQELKKYDVFVNNKLYKQAYLIPGSLKNNTQFEGKLDNREIIYANENASNSDVVFPEDEESSPINSSLVGRLKWKYIKEVLESPAFLKTAKLFFTKIKSNATKAEILNEISSFLKESSSFNYSQIHDEKTAVLKNKINIEEVQSITEKKIYIATSLIYYLFFNNPRSQILDTLLKNELQNYDPETFKIKINDQIYNIGGYASYTPQSKIVQRPTDSTPNSPKEEKIVYRYDLTPSDNFLFQPVIDLVEVHPINKALQKPVFLVLWIIIASGLLIGIYILYSRKDYK